MKNVYDFFIKYLKTLQIGKANTRLFDNLKLNHQDTKLNHISTINIINSSIIHIIPWNKKDIPMIEKSILQSNLDLSLNVSDNKIIVSIPLPNEKQRLLLVKEINKNLEDSKIKIRNIRRYYGNIIKKYIDNNKLSIDLNSKYIKVIQKLTDSTILEISVAVEKKNNDIINI